MSPQPCRLKEGGLIDRNQPLQFTFNGRRYTGFAGDTLASALLANGVRLIARSFKYHRPRGIYALGAAEPNALVQLEAGACAEPNLRAGEIELYDGLAAFSQNAWPSPAFDLSGINQLFSRLLPSGFYYKTFMWPRSAWPFYERRIRQAAGMGEAPEVPDPDLYEHKHWHGDILVVGGGPAGLAAARAAGRAGARVMLAHAGPRFGGGLLARIDPVDGQDPEAWIEAQVRELAAMDNVTVLPRTSVAGYYDNNMLTAIEQRAEGRMTQTGSTRKRLWKLRVREVVLATGAIERPLVFADNDRPGVMLAGAARRYAAQFAVAPGHRIVIATNNDSAYAAALDLHRAGARVMALVDARTAVDEPLKKCLHEAGIEYIPGSAPVRAHGRHAVTGLEVGALDDKGQWQGRTRRLPCDTVAISGGWNPTVHLFSQSQGSIRYDERLTTFVPDQPAQATSCAGFINGLDDLSQVVRQGWEAGADAARRTGHELPAMDALPVPANESARGEPIQPLWAMPAPPDGRGKRFVDLQNDVTVNDIQLAIRENYSSVEHLKRYTTLGMGTDQGRTSNVNGLAILAGLLNKPIADVGTTTFRPPYTPMTLGAVAGPRREQAFRPLRRTPLDGEHAKLGAVFVNVGIWRRPRVYPRDGESEHAAIQREAVNVRRNAGIVDVSTLGRIEVQGPDAATFLDTVYANRVGRLRTGRIRYSIMLREDGAVFDDGTVARLAEDHFHITTTTAHAGEVMGHLVGQRQRYWPDAEVYFTPATENWAVVALAGPRARDVLQALEPACDVSNDAFPFMRVQDTVLNEDLSVRLFRASYSGELAFELAVPAARGPELWQRLLSCGEPFGLTPYGTEAMSVLRIEKGHCVIGTEIDGRTGPDDIGLAGMLRKETDYVGKAGLQLQTWQDSDRKQLVGLRAVDANVPIRTGAQLVADPDHALPNPILGHVTSACFSPEQQRPVALALLKNGRQRHGETLYATSPLTGETGEVQVQAPVFTDPDGERLRS